MHTMKKKLCTNFKPSSKHSSCVFRGYLEVFMFSKVMFPGKLFSSHFPITSVTSLFFQAQLLRLIIFLFLLVIVQLPNPNFIIFHQSSFISLKSEVPLLPVLLSLFSHETSPWRNKMGVLLVLGHLGLKPWLEMLSLENLQTNIKVLGTISAYK